MVDVLSVHRKPLHDPPVRKDGLCVVCKKPRPVIDDPKGIYRVYEDPFCSTQCCRAYYHTGDEDEAISRDMSR